MKYEELDILHFGATSNTLSSDKHTTPIWNPMGFVTSTTFKLDELFLTWLLQVPSSQPFIKDNLLKSSQVATNNVEHSPLKPISNEQAKTASPIQPRSLFIESDQENRGVNININNIKFPGHLKQIPRSPPLNAISKKKKKIEPIPQFYFPPNEVQLKEQLDKELVQLRNAGLQSGQYLSLDKFISILKDVCNIPSFMSSLLFKKLNVNDKMSLLSDQFLSFWRSNFQSLDPDVRLFNILRRNKLSRTLLPDDLKPLIREILKLHPGLEILANTPDFQERYAETVITRIFYSVAKAKGRAITVSMLKTTQFMQVLNELDSETDINNMTDHFSYEHFYVIYCKFWELDTDHDLLISKDDLQRYNNNSLSNRIVDRIFQVAPYSTMKEKMMYQDFVWFILSEEDKTSEASLDYWFRCIDLDADGYLTAYEVEHFYEEQAERMELLCIEHIPFDDIFCQLIDMVNPRDKTRISVMDIKNCKLSATVLNMLFNINKFLASEQKEPSIPERDTLSPWNKFAVEEYQRVAQAETQGTEEDDEYDF